MRYNFQDPLPVIDRHCKFIVQGWQKVVDCLSHFAARHVIDLDRTQLAIVLAENFWNPRPEGSSGSLPALVPSTWTTYTASANDIAALAALAAFLRASAPSTASTQSVNVAPAGTG